MQRNEPPDCRNEISTSWGYREEAEPNTDYLGIEMVAEKAVKEFVRNYIRLIGSNDRYTFEAADNGSNEQLRTRAEKSALIQSLERDTRRKHENCND